MKKTPISSICIVACVIWSFIANKPIKDGMLCYLKERRGSDTTYTIFSGYGMRYSIEALVANELVWCYRNNQLTDTMVIVTDKCSIYGNCVVDTLTPPRLISFCAKRYVLPSGKIELVQSEFCKE